ncbi:MAG: hypothetical protein MI755_16840 [Sphingomonadales bacterium]|nr:hypothetical protein [Sphingomonadales bacterium]
MRRIKSRLAANEDKAALAGDESDQPDLRSVIDVIACYLTGLVLRRLGQEYVPDSPCLFDPGDRSVLGRRNVPDSRYGQELLKSKWPWRGRLCGGTGDAHT